MPLNNVDLYRIDGTIGSVSNIQTSAINGGPIAGARNRVINGDMRIDQRAAIVTNTGSYPVDRWKLEFTTSGAVQSAQSNDFPTGFSASLLFDVTAADTSIAAGEYGVLSQYIEGLNASDLNWGTASAQTATLSFWVKSTTTGTYCVSFRNSSASRSYVATYSVASANTWEYKTITVPGDTSGTWLGTNGVGIIVAFCFATGSTFQTTAGAWQAGNFLGTSAQTNLLASTANEIRITGVQLEPGTVATPFERRSYGQELALCQRYYEVINYLPVGITYAPNGDTRHFTSFATTKRVAPTMGGFPHSIVVIASTYLGEGVNLNGTLNSAVSSIFGFQANSMGNSVNISIASGGGQIVSWGEAYFRTVTASAEL